MQMKRTLWAVLVVALAGCEDIQGNGDIVEQERPTGTFSGVFLAAGLHGDITVGVTPSVKIRGDSNLLDFIRLELRDGILTSDLDQGLSLLPSEPIVVTVVTPTLTELQALNGTRMSASGIDTESLTLRVAGRSTVNVSGTARKLTLVAVRNGEVQAGDLAVEVAEIAVSDSSRARLHVTQQISGTASSGSDVTVLGNPPQSDIATSGGGQVLFE
ncbi:GIN domain-containing protein [Hyalangium sp.]|uniref:GIN domain-containing protein n=1 Tax=Hyalangium sp. TaxID=2028555 RepID=UPI002D632653|nr:DUF2807 domain-containing protein [Hyalangium sp.]HYH99887.1 DUF2807 domain-containing protein [Hyalangium sp.]